MIELIKGLNNVLKFLLRINYCLFLLFSFYLFDFFLIYLHLFFPIQIKYYKNTKSIGYLDFSIDSSEVNAKNQIFRFLLSFTNFTIIKSLDPIIFKM